MILDEFLIPLKSTESQITGVIGAPLKKTAEEEHTVLWYKSKVPHKADIYYLQNDALDRVTHSYVDKNVTIDTVIKELGPAEESIRKSNAQNDSLQEVVYAWPAKGFRASVIGKEATARITSIEHFEPTTLQTYTSTLGVKYKGNEKISFQSPVATSLANPSSLPQNQMGTSIKSFILPTIVIISLLVIILLLFLKRIRKIPNTSESITEKKT